MNNKREWQASDFENVYQEYAAPILTNYVWWILREAEKRHIECLYFLARDGLILQKIAQQLCIHFGLHVTCRYLYTSRMALRTPSYHLLSKEEMFEQLLGYSYQVTPNSILRRVIEEDRIRGKILDEVGVSWNKRDMLLTRIEAAELADQLRENRTFLKEVQKRSVAAFQPTITYFRQEGLLASDSIAIVDSGWNGTMQSGLRLLLDNAGYSGKIIGFYFGLFREPIHGANSEYLSWYFTPKSELVKKAKFSNNVFEWICAAPHGTTLGYVQRRDRVEPVLAPSASLQQDKMIKRQIDVILSAVPEIIGTRSFDSFSACAAKKETRTLTNSLMYRPTRQTADVFSSTQFCDDICESYYSPLADPQQAAELKRYTVYAQLVRALKRKSQRMSTIPWPYGAVAFLPRYKQGWYRMNILMWEMLKNSPARWFYGQIRKSGRGKN